MTDIELTQTMRRYRERREMLGISANEFGREIGFSGTAILSWETMTYKPRPVYVMAMVKLLDDLEAGRKELPVKKSNLGAKTKHTMRILEATILIGLLRRLLGIPSELGVKELGVNEREFQLKESGLASMTKAELSSLLRLYAEQISPAGSSQKQLTFTDSLAQSELGCSD